MKFQQQQLHPICEEEEKDEGQPHPVCEEEEEEDEAEDYIHFPS